MTRNRGQTIGGTHWCLLSALLTLRRYRVPHRDEVSWCRLAVLRSTSSDVPAPSGADSPHPDRRANFERIALPVAPALYRTACRLSRRPDDARDVVQETFLRAYRTFANFEPGTNVKAWLFTILYSIVSNRWRAERRAPDELAVDDLESRFGAALASEQVNAEQALLQRLEASPEVDRALQGLPDAQRATILLVDVEELTYEEAAAVLECPVGTVRSRLARGRKQLYVALAEFARRSGALRDK
jgi:RNA polymerase sigma-70 factor, ECF subfamily